MDLQQILKQAQGMSSKLGEVQSALRERVVDAAAGGGLVTAYVNGDQQLVKIEIDPKAVDPDDPGLLEDLVVAAVNKALGEMKELIQAELTKAAGGRRPGLI